MQAALRFVIFQADSIGHRITSLIKYVYDVLMMIYLSFRAALFEQSQGLRTRYSVVSAQIYFTGWQAMPIISVLAIASGSVVIIQAASNLSMLGGQDALGQLLVVVIVREISPLLTALVVVARSGTAVASELGNMKVNKEIEALEVMGIHPLSYIVFPRILGGMISVLCLSFYFIFIAIIGGFFVSRLMIDLQFDFYLTSIANAITQEDALLFFLKNAFSGAIIFVVCSYQGMLVKRSPHEVPQVTTKAVMNSIVFVIAFNMTVTLLFYLNELRKIGLL
jgi:phospholipid/cholesterol/gamma-HCH transport system permease protein